jgi:hypothetical protein
MVNVTVYHLILYVAGRVLVFQFTLAIKNRTKQKPYRCYEKRLTRNMTVEFGCEKYLSCLERQEFELIVGLVCFLKEHLNQLKLGIYLNLMLVCDCGRSVKLQAISYSQVDNCETNGSTIDTSVVFFLQLSFSTPIYIYKKRGRFLQRRRV